MVGSIHSVCNAVMIASRPNAVLYQGMPAYGYGPSGLSVISMARSEIDRRIASLNTSFDVAIAAAREADLRSARRARRTALKNTSSPDSLVAAGAATF